jgi:Zinc finger, C2H2 type
MTVAASALQPTRAMLDTKCRDCGQSFKTPAELQEHADRVHQMGKKGGSDQVAPVPPNDRRR